MQLKDILSEEEIADLKKSWCRFSSLPTSSEPEANCLVNKYKQEHVVIGKAFQYKGFPIFRAKVLTPNRFWIEHDPPQPIWHDSEYFEVFEQICHSGRHKLSEQEGFVYKGRGYTTKCYNDMFRTINFNQRIWVENILEIEHIRKERERRLDFNTENLSGHIRIYLRAGYELDKEKNYARFYNAKGDLMAEFFVSNYGLIRDYELLIEELKEGENIADLLIKKIELQDKKLKKIRRTPKTTSENLIQQLKQGKIPEAELHDFFSFWDKE